MDRQTDIRRLLARARRRRDRKAAAGEAPEGVYIPRRARRVTLDDVVRLMARGAPQD